MFSNQFLRAEDEKAQMEKKSINWSFQYLLQLLKSPELPGVLVEPPARMKIQIHSYPENPSKQEKQKVSSPGVC